MSYRKHLTAFGLADSRSFDLSMQVRSLHQAVAQLDDRNLKMFEALHPGVIELVDTYAEQEGGGLRRFMKEDDLTGLKAMLK